MIRLDWRGMSTYQISGDLDIDEEDGTVVVDHADALALRDELVDAVGLPHGAVWHADLANPDDPDVD